MVTVSQKSAWLRYGLAAVIFGVGIVLTLAAANMIYNFEREQVERETEHLLQSHMTGLQRQLDLTSESIQAMGAYIGALALIRQEVIKQYAQEMLQRQGIVSIAWVSWIQDTQRSVYEQTVQKEGVAEFKITQRNAQGHIERAHSRQHYFPITYIEPFEHHQSVLGFDMGSEQWLHALEEARDQGTSIATSPLLIEPVPAAHFRIGIVQPVYHGGLPNTLAARRANLRGFIFVTLDVQEMTQQILDEFIDDNIIVELTLRLATTADEQTTKLTPELWTQFSQESQDWSLFSPHNALHQWVNPYHLAQKDILLMLKLNIDLPLTNSVWGILIGGPLLTLLLVAYLLMLTGRTRRVERLVAERTAALRESESHLIQSEKMATIGQMVAGIVHEINTPLAYVRSSIELTKDHISNISETLNAYEKLGSHFKSDGRTQTAREQLEMAMKLLRALHEDDTFEEAQILLDNSIDGIDKISTLVKNLRNFSRLDRAKTAEHDVNQGLDEALVMVHHMLSDNIKIMKHYGEVPTIICSPAQMNQVFLNLLVNAIQSIEDQGMVDITTRSTAQYVEIIIKDEGKGIEAEHLNRIFEPFFTTKDTGSGTGLGLTIAYKIVKEHGGDIKVTSELNRGTQFNVILPLTQTSETPPESKQGTSQ